MHIVAAGLQYWLGPIFYFYIYVSSSVLSYCSIKHDDDDDDDDDKPLKTLI